jgi:hypothetical protein
VDDCIALNGADHRRGGFLDTVGACGHDLIEQTVHVFAKLLPMRFIFHNENAQALLQDERGMWVEIASASTVGGTGQGG